MVLMRIYDKAHVSGTESLNVNDNRLMDDGGFVVAIYSGIGKGRIKFVPRINVSDIFLPNIWYDCYLGVTDDNEAYISGVLKSTGIHHTLMNCSEETSEVS